MSNETNAAAPHEIDGGAPTDEEARLAAQLATIGDNPETDPDAAAATEAAGTGTEGAGAGAPSDAATTAVTDGAPVAADANDAAATPPASSAAAPAAATTAEAPQAQPAAAAPPVPQRPAPPKNFDEEFAAIQKRYDDGELDSAEFQSASRSLSKEEAAYQTRVTLWEENQAAAQQSAQASFATAAVAWEQANKDFMSNPLRAEAMNRAIAVIDQQTGGTLSPQALLEQAAKVAFEAFGYQVTQAAPPAGQPSAEEAIARATEARKTPPVPTTLGTAPAAAAIERGGGNAAFAELDGKDINTLEDAVARMTPQQREAYLLDAPGAKATGVPE